MPVVDGIHPIVGRRLGGYTPIPVKRKSICVLEPSLRNGLQELISANFKQPEIDELGRLVFREYDSHRIAGEDRHITISRKRAASLLVETAEEQEKVDDLVKLIAELDGGVLAGHSVSVTGIEAFFNALARTGVLYDADHRRLFRSEDALVQLKNWGSLRDGRSYQMSVMSVDIVGNSALVRTHGQKVMEKLYYELWQFLNRKLSDYDGRLWNWAGDGGILAFTFADHVNRAVKCAIDIQISVPLFNISPENPLSEPLVLRTAIDTGKIRFYRETGKIVSEVINYAAHLEKEATEPGTISLSERGRRLVDPKILSIFRNGGEFEGISYVATTQRLDGLFMAPEGCEEPDGTRRRRRKTSA